MTIEYLTRILPPQRDWLDTGDGWPPNLNMATQSGWPALAGAFLFLLEF